MADIEILGPHVEPPEDQDWVKVDKGTLGAYFVHASIAGGKGAAFSTSEPLANKAAAMELAQQIASQHGIAVIHTKGL